METIRESDLPGIGRKFQLLTVSGEKVVVIVHDDGKRTIYYFVDSSEEPTSMITLSDKEARQLAGIIGGLTYTPKYTESADVNINDLVIEWIKIEPDSIANNQNIAELKIRENTGATVIAIVGKNVKKINPDPSQTIREESILVIAGERNQVNACIQFLAQKKNKKA